MKTILVAIAVGGLGCSVGIVLFMEFFVGGGRLTYEAATSFGVISIAATSFYRLLLEDEKPR